MDDNNEVDFNAAMFDLIEPQRPQVPAISNDSDLGSSISGFGIDAEEQEANHENQQLQVHGARLGNPHPEEENSEKGSDLGTSISKTRTSEFIPEIIEYNKKPPTTTTLDSIDENAGEDFDKNNDGQEKTVADEENLNAEIYDCESAFDLALDKGYHDQALYYLYSNDRGLNTKRAKLLGDILDEKDKNKTVAEKGYEALNENVFPIDFVLELVQIFEADAKRYLECVQKKQYNKIKRMIEEKRSSSDLDEKILSYINSGVEGKQLEDLIIKEINQRRELFEDIDRITNKFKKYLENEEQLHKKIQICKNILNDKNVSAKKKEDIAADLRVLENMILPSHNSGDENQKNILNMPSTSR